MYTRELPPQPAEVLFDELDGIVHTPEAGGDSDENSWRNLSDTARALDLLAASAETEESLHKVQRGTNTGLADGLKQRQQSYHDQAYAYFARADGAYDRISAGEDPAEVHRNTWNLFGKFKDEFAGLDKAAERTAHKQELIARFAALTAATATVERQATNLPERKTPYPAYLGEGKEREATPTTRERLTILYEDVHARFLPTTHREKNTALALLDYIKNPKHPRGVVEQLDEIYVHQANVPLVRLNKAKEHAQKLGIEYIGQSSTEAYGEGQAMGGEATRSVVQEWGDYVMSARYAVTELTSLADLVDKYDNPRLSLKDIISETGINAPDVQPLLRFLDLQKFRESGELPDPLFDPLRTREIRNVDIEGKNKVVTDVYMLPADCEHLGEQFDRALSSITIGSLRGVMREAIMDSHRRMMFFRNCLGAIPTTSKHYQYAQQAIQVAA